jgi:signal transduction histidine kinase
VNTLATFIREKRQRILDDWLEAASLLPSAYGLSTPVIRDHIPEILDTLTDAIDRDDATALPMKGLPNLHAAIRAREGYDLRQVVAEYRALRRVIHRLYSEQGDMPDPVRPKMQSLQVMHAAIDAAIADAVDQFGIDRDKSREMFISMLGHDLRDPLNIMAFCARFLWQDCAGEVSPRALKAAIRISGSATRMERMIGDLLDFAHSRLVGGLPVVPVPVDARPIIADTIQEIADANPDRNIQCGVQRTSGALCVVWDSDRVMQAISNLVGNAIAHGEDPVVVDAIDRGEQVTIEVRNGGGIPPEILPRLFDPFTHTGGERRHAEGSQVCAERRRGHLGLGLYIVRQIAEAHGGSVEAASSDGHTIFRFTLPRHAGQTMSAIADRECTTNATQHKDTE